MDERQYVTLSNAFKQIFEHYSQIPEDDDDIPDKYIRVRKLIVTPSRLILMPGEIMKSNRILRRFGEEWALRVLFREENGRKLLISWFDETTIQVLLIVKTVLHIQ